MPWSLKFHLVVLDIFFNYATLGIEKKISQISLHYVRHWIFIMLMDFVKL